MKYTWEKLYDEDDSFLINEKGEKVGQVSSVGYPDHGFQAWHRDKELRPNPNNGSALYNSSYFSNEKSAKEAVHAMEFRRNVSEREKLEI